MKKLFMLLCAAFALSSATAQVPDQLPIDPAVRKGKLENGMTYYIRHNEKPKGQADFYIWHDVGAIQEDDHQQGLAHFLEHMSFNGTKNLPGKQLTEYLEKIGVKFGQNLNAYTTWDRTVYNIADVPTTRQGIIDTAMLILHDWSHFIALEPKEIDSERGVIMEELRTRDGAGWRSTIKMLQAVGKGTQYEHRNLIGYLDDLKSFQHDALEGFYKAWYRPEYQAVVIVGDIDVDATEKHLKELMADIPASPKDARQKEVIVIPDNEAPIVSIYTDPEMQQTQAQLFIKRQAMPKEMNNTVVGVSMDLLNAYFSIMANARFSEISMKPDAPFQRAGMGSGSFGICPTLEVTTLSLTTKDGELAAGFEAALTEMERIRRFGFTMGEFERAQNDLMRYAEQDYNNRNDRTNGKYVNACLENFGSNAYMLDAETEWQYSQMLIKQIPLEAVNNFAQQIIFPKNNVLVVNAPQKEGLATPTEEELLAVRERVLASEQIEAYKDTVVKEPLIADDVVLEGSPVQTSTQDQLLGTTEWILKNGAKVILKQTQFKADEVRMDAFAKGGLALLNEEEYHMGALMSAINSMSGVGKFSSTELKKQLSGKSAGVSSAVSPYESGMQGVCSPKDLETMMQLLYLNFTQPRFNLDDYNTLMNLLRTQLANIEKNPDYMMQKMRAQTLYGNNPLRQELSMELLEKFQFEQLPTIYKKLFPGVNGFTFVFVGNVDAETLKPLVEKYIGSIPAQKEPMKYVDDKVRKVRGEVKKDFKVEMQQPKVSVFYDFSGESTYTIKDVLTMQFLGEALNSRYLISAREEKGGTYGVGVAGRLANEPEKIYRLIVMFDTNKEMADELMEVIIDEIETIAKEGPVVEDIEKNREFLAKQWKNAQEQNGDWMRYIKTKETTGLNYFADFEKELRQLKAEDVQQMAQRILKNKNMIRVVMYPEEKED